MARSVASLTLVRSHQEHVSSNMLDPSPRESEFARPPPLSVIWTLNSLPPNSLTSTAISVAAFCQSARVWKLANEQPLLLRGGENREFFTLRAAGEEFHKFRIEFFNSLPEGLRESFLKT